MIDLTKEMIDEIFERATHQQNYLTDLYKIAYPNFEKIYKISGFPKCGFETNNYISYKAIHFDRKIHPNVLSGGLWLNNGFSTDHDMPEWKISTDDTRIVYKKRKHL